MTREAHRDAYRIPPLREADAICLNCQLEDCIEESQKCPRRTILLAEQADRRKAANQPLEAKHVRARARRRWIRQQQQRATQ